MAKYSNIKLTQKGLDMAINADKSKKLIYTHIGIGDGSLADGEDILTLTDMKSRKILADISDINNDTQNQITLETVVSNKILNEGFYAREIGIYAKLGENGQEVLYGYANAGDNCDFMPDKAQPIDELKLRITLIVGNVDNVTAIINSSIIFITLADCRREIARHNADPLAHGKLAKKDEVYTKNEVDSRVNNKVSKSGDTMTGTLHFAHENSHIIGRINDTDYYRITGIKTGDNSGYLEIAVADDQDEGIVCRQYGSNGYHYGDFSHPVREAWILNKYGDADFPNALTANTFYANDWFRARGNSGFYFQDHGGGWFMSDNDWMRSFNNKHIYTGGRIKADGGFEGKATTAGRADTADNATNFSGRSLSNILGLIDAANTGAIEARLEENGYIKIRNGFMLQWGVLKNVKIIQSEYDINFSKQFNNRCFNILLSLVQPTFVSATNNVYVKTGTVTKTGFKVIIDHSVEIYNGDVFYVAIGV